MLIERGTEFEFLENLFLDADSGHGSIALVNGAVASGKTELLRTFAEHRARDGAVVLTVTGDLPQARTQELTRLIAGSANGSELSSTLCSFDIVNIFLELMLELSEKAPVLITVDDAQHVDESSMECLLHVANHTRSARIMLLMAELVHGRSVHPSYRIELVRQVNFRRLRLAPLSSDGVSKLLAQHLNPDVVRRLAPGCHAITRGNPLLVRALIEDQLDWPEPGPDARPIVGDAFRHAVLICLRRSGPEVLALARVVSVLGPGSTVDRLSRLVHRTLGEDRRRLDRSRGRRHHSMLACRCVARSHCPRSCGRCAGGYARLR